MPQSTSRRERSEGWLARVLRILFGWKAGCDARRSRRRARRGATGETGFSPKKRAMLKNILALRECRSSDVMVPRADIVAVQQDIALGELVERVRGRRPFAARRL